MAGFDLGLDAVAHKFRHAISRDALHFSSSAEFEIKYMARDGLQTLSKILKELPMLTMRSEGRRQVPATDIFLLTPEFFYKPYTLANFGLDTVGADGMPEFGIYREGYQLRQRFSVRAYLPSNHPYAIGVSQCSVKNLYSRDRSAQRLEIEKKMPGMKDSASQFIQAEKSRLPGFFADIDGSRLGVSAAFMTSRGSYLIGVYLREQDAIAAFEVSNDQTLNMTPNLAHITREYAHEWEAEAKQIFFMKSSKTVIVDPKNQGNVMLASAERKIREYISRGFGDELREARKSKLERAMDDCHKHFEKTLSGGFNSAAQSYFLSADNMPKLGAQYALGHGISMGYVQNQRNRLMELSRVLTNARDLVSAPGIAKTKFEVLEADRAPAPALVHG